MTLRRVPSRGFVLPLLVMLIVPQPGLFAQQDKVAALKQSLAANEKLQKQYRWVETTVVSMKGEEKSRVQKQCFYGPDGKVQKQQLTAPPPQEPAPGEGAGRSLTHPRLQDRGHPGRPSQPGDVVVIGRGPRRPDAPPG